MEQIIGSNLIHFGKALSLCCFIVMCLWWHELRPK